MVKVEYTDGAHWTLRINEISELRHSIGYEVLATEPIHSATSIQGVITLHNVTALKHTYVEWATDFSNDADAQVIADQKYKKLEFFAEMAKTFEKKA